jgi:hypothetical protein
MKHCITFFIILFGCIANLFAQWGHIPEIPTINNKGNRTQTYPNVTTINSSVQGLLNQVNINNLENDIRYMQNLGIRWAQSPAALQTQNWLVEKFESFGLDVTIHRFTSSEPPASGDTIQAGNVVAIKKGTEFPDQYIIISSHYDHQSGPGADDNASGTAGVVECARIFSQIETKRSIIFVPFNAEESWLHGSVPFAIKCAMENKNILGMFNLDMLGYYPAAGYGDIKMYTGHSLINQKLFEYYVQVANLYIPDVPTLRFSNGDSRASDICSFIWNDYPAIYIGNIEHITIHPCYHKPCDTIGEFGGVNNMNLVKAYTQATLAAVAELANGWLPPQNFSAISGIEQITLSWDEMPETSKYKVYKNDILLTETTSTSYTDNNIVLGEAYTYFVKGIREGSSEESNPSNIDYVVFSLPLTIPYSLNLTGDKKELKYWWYNDWVIRIHGGFRYLAPRLRNFSIMELDWFPIPENTAHLSLHIAALNHSLPSIMQSFHGFIEITTDRKTWHKLAKNIDFPVNTPTPDTLTVSLNEYIGVPFFQLRIRVGSVGRDWDAGIINLFSIDIDHTTVSIKENKKIAYFKNLQIYPNPTTGILTVKTESENSYELAVYDLFGKKMYQDKGFRDGMLNVSNLSKGTYFIQVAQDNHQMAKKIVVQ